MVFAPYDARKKTFNRGKIDTYVVHRVRGT